jgi:mevalonate kinase
MGRYDHLFDKIGEIAVAARSAIEQGQKERLGQLMDQNHSLLQQMGVSCPELDRLVVAAREGGALGAKLSGAGWGGNMIALITVETRERLGMLLHLAGAAQVIITEVR